MPAWKRIEQCKLNKLNALVEELVVVVDNAETEAVTDNPTVGTEAAVEVVEHSNARSVSVLKEECLKKRQMRRTKISPEEKTWMKRSLSHSRWLPRSKRTSRTPKPTSLLCEHVQQLLQKEMTKQVSWLVGRSLPGHLPTVLNNVGEQMSGLWLSLCSNCQLALATTG